MRNEFIISKLNMLPYNNNLLAIKPFEILCQSGFCPAVLDNKALYFDDNHLSTFGSSILLNNISIQKK